MDINVNNKLNFYFDIIVILCNNNIVQFNIIYYFDEKKINECIVNKIFKILFFFLILILFLSNVKY